MQGITSYKSKTAFFLAGCLFSNALLAGTVPTTLTFEEGERFNLSLSNTNFNRIFVEGEKITQLNFPEGSFTVDKSEMELPLSQEGSVYLKPMLDIPLTVFFATDKGHHFSLTVKPIDAAGNTVRLLIKNQTTLKYVKRYTNHIDEVESVMRAMQLGEMPKNFKLARVQSQPFYIKHDVKVTLEKHYLGMRLAGYVYRLENKSTRTEVLTTALFNKHQVVSLVLSDESLAPKQVGYLYALYHIEG